MMVGGLAVEVVRKDIKNLHLGVYPPTGRVRVAAPVSMGDESIRLADFVAALDSVADFDAKRRRFPRMLPKRKHKLIGIRHAPNRKVARESLLLRRMYAMPESSAEADHLS